MIKVLALEAVVGSIEDILRGAPVIPATSGAEVSFEVPGCNPTNQC